MKTRLALAAAAALSLTALAACSATETPAASGGDGAATIAPITVACGNVEELCEAVISEFTKSTGTKADYVRLSGGEILARLESNKGAPQAEFDVWWGGPAESFATGADRGLLAVYDSPERANIDPALRDTAGYWTGNTLNPIGLCSNTAVLERIGADVPTAWADVIAPEFRQNVATSHPATAGTGFSFLATQVALHDGDEDAAFEYLAQLHPNVLQYTKSGAAPVQMVVRGEVASVVAFASVCEREHVVNGNDDIVMSYPSEGVGFEVGAMGVVAGTANEAGAHAFVDWALGQEAFDAHIAAGYNVFPPFVAGGDNNLGQTVDEIPFLEHFDPVAFGDHRSRLAERFDREIAPAPIN